jgi:hypothetical protein
MEPHLHLSNAWQSMEVVMAVIRIIVAMLVVRAMMVIMVNMAW